MVGSGKSAGIFVTGTDTGVGKTYVTAAVARSLRQRGVRVGAYKPVCSGAEFAADGTPWWSDVRTLSVAIGGADEDRVGPQRFKAPLAPPLAADLEGAVADFEQSLAGAAWWQARVDVLLVEGAGGLLCPLTESTTMADLAVALDYRLMIVARANLGTINHTLLTVEAAQRRGLAVCAVILSEAEGPVPTCDQNAAEIGRRANVPLVAVVRHGSQEPELPGGDGAGVNWTQIVAGTVVPTDPKSVDSPSVRLT